VSDSLNVEVMRKLDIRMKKRSNMRKAIRTKKYEIEELETDWGCRVWDDQRGYTLSEAWSGVNWADLMAA